MKITNQNHDMSIYADMQAAASLPLKFWYQVAIRKAKLDGAKVYTHYIEVTKIRRGRREIALDYVGNNNRCTYCPYGVPVLAL